MQTRVWILLSVVWICSVIGGFAILNRYATLSGQSIAAPRQLPHSATSSVQASSDQISAIPNANPQRTSNTPKKPLLLMFAHPRCPCTRASLSEFARIVARCRSSATFRILFFAPSAVHGMSSAEALAWVQADNLWQRACAIDGVEVAVDVGGEEAKRFHAISSGHTVLYDAQGKLLFYGGITAARGHEGDNDGKNAIVQALLGAERHSTLVASTPTFGCAIEQSKNNTNTKQE